MSLMLLKRLRAKPAEKKRSATKAKESKPVGEVPKDDKPAIKKDADK